MQTDRIPPARVQRAVVLQLLREDHPQSWARVDLEGEIGAPIRGVLARLASSDVIVTEGDHVRASRCAMHLHALDLIAV